jgi:sugar transferase (PEP-CTERM/EpsH1 system associated)
MEIIKICYIIGQLRRGGAERQLYELVRGIDRNRFEPIVISLSQGGHWADKIRELNIQVIELERRKNKEFARLWRLIKLIRKIKPKIVHTYLFPANSYGRVAANVCRVPIIIASERSLPEIGKGKTKTMIYIDKILSPFSHAIICNSLRASEVLIKHYSFNPEKVFTVYNGIDVAAISNNGNNENQKVTTKVVGIVGSLEPVKNHKLFLQIAKIIIDQTSADSIKFLIVGKGSLRKELEEFAANLGIKDSVIFTGERTDIPELLHTMDVFVLTSQHEGLSNAVMEAMAAGIPVVATDVGGNSELIINDETGFLCLGDDSEAFAERVIYLLNNDDKAKQMGEKGKRKIMNRFRVERMIKETENIYLTLLEKK